MRSVIPLLQRMLLFLLPFFAESAEAELFLRSLRFYKAALTLSPARLQSVIIRPFD